MNEVQRNLFVRRDDCGESVIVGKKVNNLSSYTLACIICGETMWTKRLLKNIG